MVQAPTRERRPRAGSQPRPDDGADIIETHRGLIYRYARKRAKPGVEFDDLYQEGAIAILEAHQVHDPQRGAFSTVADFHLKNAMNAAEAKGSIANPANLSRSTLSEVRRLRAALARLHSSGCGHPSTPEIADEAGLPQSRARALVPLLYSSLGQVTYLSVPTGEDGEGELGELIAADREDPAESAAADDERRRLWWAMEEVLTEGERTIVEAAYGLDGRGERGAGEIAAEMGISCRQSLYNRLSEARRKLRQALSEDRLPLRAAA